MQLKKLLVDKYKIILDLIQKIIIIDNNFFFFTLFKNNIKKLLMNIFYKPLALFCIYGLKNKNKFFF